MAAPSSTLIIDTVSAACSAALLDADGTLLAEHHETIERGHAERLMPAIAAPLRDRRPDAILVDCGPGSFTGIRVGIAAARGLGIGWGVPVHGLTSTALVAAAHAGSEALAVVLEGGHGEVFMQGYAFPLAATDALVSLTPEAARAALAGRRAVGNGVRHLDVDDAVEALPDARDARLLPSTFTQLPPRPIYGRPPDAKPNP